jgi:hypothetical protein
MLFFIESDLNFIDYCNRNNITQSMNGKVNFRVI